MMKPILYELMKTSQITTVKIGENKDNDVLAEKYNVQSLPTFIQVDETGKEISRLHGMQPEESIKKLLKK